MTTISKTTAEIHALIDVLAAATVACPDPPRQSMKHTMSCLDCHGTGTIPRFPGARRECPDKCKDCEARGGWFPDYDAHIEALLASLLPGFVEDICAKWLSWAQHIDSTPPADEIRVAKLRAIVEVAE